MEFKGFSVTSQYTRLKSVITPTFQFSELANVGHPEDIELHIRIPSEKSFDSAFFFSGTFARKLEAD